MASLRIGAENPRTIIEASEDSPMPRCETCGNEYDKTFEVHTSGERHVFDSFECAIHALAPSCAHCGCRIIGHGVEAEDEIFCCANCARNADVQTVKDRA